MKSLFCILLFISWVDVTCADDEIGASEENHFLKYKIKKGDWPLALLRRLELKPLYGKKGFLEKFFEINPDIAKEYAARPSYRIPPETEVNLPIKGVKGIKNISLSENGYLRFLGENHILKTNDVTKVLNLKNLKSKKRSWKRSWKPKRKRLAAQKVPRNWENFQYKLGQPVAKFTIGSGSPLYKKMQKQGFISLTDNKKKIRVEVPLEYQGEILYKTRLRKVAAVGKSRLKTDFQAPLAIQVSSLMVSRLYNIVDSQGQKGDIGTEPSFGASFGFDYRYSFLDLEGWVLFQNEKFKSDRNISISQQTSTRTNFRLRQAFDLGFLNLKLGGGLAQTPGFFSSSNTQLSAKHISRPYIHLAFNRSFYDFFSDRSSIELAYDQLLAASEDVYSFESGFQVTVYSKNSWNLSGGFSLTADLGIMYSDDKPKFYQQSQLGLQGLLGLSWQWGSDD